MTETSLFPMAAKRHGFSFKDVINKIIKLSLQKWAKNNIIHFQARKKFSNQYQIKELKLMVAAQQFIMILI